MPGRVRSPLNPRGTCKIMRRRQFPIKAPALSLTPDQPGLTAMQREFGKRTFERPPREAPVQTASSGKQTAIDPEHMRKAVLAIVLTVTIVGGMFILPK